MKPEPIMKLWLLSRQNHALELDEYDAKIVRAPDEQTARNIANTEPYPGQEGAIWTDPDLVRCEELLPSGPAGVVLASFNAG